jgi:WD40 repeat protein
MILMFMSALQWSHALELPAMHKKGVTCLAGRMVSGSVSIFASTSSDGTVVIWEMEVEPTTSGRMIYQHFDTLYTMSYLIRCILKSRIDPKNLPIPLACMILKLLKMCSVLPLKLFGFSSAGSCKVSCLHSLSVGLKPMVSLSLAVLPEQEDRLILAMGGLDHKVHIYCGDLSGKVCKSSILPLLHLLVFLALTTIL